MKKNILKKIFIKISKLLGLELIDQNEFKSPTLNKDLNEELSTINKKSIVIPLGEVQITRKIKSVLIIVRTNTNIDIWDQNKKRIFEFPKIEYTLRSIFSLLKSVKLCKNKYKNIDFKIIVIDDQSNEQNLSSVKNLLIKSGIDFNLVSLIKDKYNKIIKSQKNDQTFSNLSSLLESFETAKKNAEDLVFFLEDDYLHFSTMVEEIIATYERISSQLKKDIFICPADYPYLYMENKNTNILVGNKRHWRTVDKTLCTFVTSKYLINKYWDNLYKNCLDRHDPFEKYINENYRNEFCFSPIKSLSIHLTNINSSYGLSPFIDYKKIWEDNNYND